MLRHVVREWCRGNTTDFDSVVLGSIPSSRATYASVAQPVEQRTFNPLVVGSTPATRTINMLLRSPCSFLTNVQPVH